jgi:8-oxo-dGTP pyrophosphatase MutT (NUDIX family)/GNAT superfamily N-acetyltransferase
MGEAGGSPKAPDPNKGSRDEEDENGLKVGEGHTKVVTQDPDAAIHVHLGPHDRGHVQLGADAFNPNEPRDASGKFGSGGGAAPATLAHVEAHWDQHGISHHLSEHGDTITLSKIALPKEARGQGIGTQAMHSLTAYADANGKTIALTPSTHFGASSVARLTDFYKQFGFTPNKGRKRDFSTTESMLRRPAKQAQDADPEWDESKIKRADNGQFGSGGGAATAKTAKQAQRAKGAKAPKTGAGTSASLPGVSHETNASNADVPAGAVTFSTKKPASGSLHGVAFKPWDDHPTTSEGWQAEADKGPEFEEPEVPPLKGGRKQAAGVIVQEPDGRVWTIRPSNAYGGYKASFPKGGVDKGDSLRSTAIKEAFEESGLRVELTGFAGDAQRDTSQARYYYARRIGGSPSEHGWESEAVALVPPGELHQHLNKPIDRLIAQHTIEGGDEHHPLDFSKMKKVGGALGSNPGGEYEDPDSGRRFYAKESKSESHAKNELLATRLYEMARSPVLPIMPATVGGKLGTASEWHHGKQNIDIDNKEDRRAAQKNFATHAWLANWDVIGMGQHENDWNQARLDGEMHTLDTGGALLYRAQGGPKGEAFGNEATEWDTLRQKSLAAKVFGEMSPRRLRESAERVTSIPDHAIRAAVHTHGPGTAAEKDALADKLIARKNDIKKRADALPASDEAIESFAGAADAMIGEWDESAVKRDEGGKFATSASGGGGSAPKPSKPVPELTKYAGPAGAKMKKALEEHIASGNDNPHELATLMKTEAGKMKSSNVAGFMNQLIDHLADHHSMPKGALGKAVKMKGGVEGPPSQGAPSEAEMEKMAAADPLENFQLNPAAPPPTPQGGKVPIAAVHAILTGPGHLQQKIDTLKDLKKAAELQGHDISEATAGLNQLEQEMGESLPPHDGTAVQQEMWEVAAHGHWKTDNKIKQLESDAKGGSGPTRDYAKKLIAAIKGEPPTAEPGTAAQSIAGIEQGIIPPLPAMFKGNGTIVNIHSMADKGFTKSTGLLDYMNKGLASGVIKEGSAEHGYAKAVIMAKVAQENGATPPTPKNIGMKGKVDDIVADPGLTAQQKIDAINYTIIENTFAPPGHKDYAEIQVNKLKNEVAASWSKPPMPPQGPAPNAKSQHQQNLYDIASGTGTNEEKVEQLKTYPTVVNYPDGYSAKFANSWIKSLGGEPIPGVGFADAATPSVPTPAAPKAAPAAPKAPPSPSKPNSTKHADAEVLAWANKTYNGATQLSSTKSAKARKIAPSLEQKFWDSVDHKAKSATESYCGSGSGSMNGVLRGQIDADTSHAVAPVKAVHSLYKREETKLTEDVVLRRGVGSTTIGKLIPGWLAGLKAGLPCYYNTEGFVSTSMADKAAFSGKPVILEMTCRKGTRALGADTVSGLNENELLLMHGQQFEVYEIVPGAQTTIRMISGKHVEGE